MSTLDGLLKAFRVLLAGGESVATSRPNMMFVGAAISDDGDNQATVINLTAAESFATHDARVADVGPYNDNQLGQRAIVTSDGTVWELAATTPRWELAQPKIAVRSQSTVADSGGEKEVSISLADGFVYDLRFRVTAYDGSGGVEYVDTYDVVACADGGVATLLASAQGLTDSAVDWSTAIDVDGAENVRATITNDTANARVVLATITITGVSQIPA